MFDFSFFSPLCPRTLSLRRSLHDVRIMYLSITVGRVHPFAHEPFLRRSLHDVRIYLLQLEEYSRKVDEQLQMANEKIDGEVLRLEDIGKQVKQNFEAYQAEVFESI